MDFFEKSYWKFQNVFFIKWELIANAERLPLHVLTRNSSLFHKYVQFKHPPASPTHQQPAYSSTHAFTHSPTHPLIHPRITHAFIHSLSCPSIHSSIRLSSSPPPPLHPSIPVTFVGINPRQFNPPAIFNLYHPFTTPWRQSFEMSPEYPYVAWWLCRSQKYLWWRWKERGGGGGWGWRWQRRRRRRRRRRSWRRRRRRWWKRRRWWRCW